MITVKKLLTLKERTRLRKISMILHEAAVDLRNGNPVDLEYINEVLPVAGRNRSAVLNGQNLKWWACCW